ALIEKLKTGDAAVRADTADDLRSLGSKGAPAAAALREMLDDPVAAVRMAAAAALLHIDSEDGRARGRIEADLGSEEAGVRKKAARAAGLGGHGAVALVPVLAKLLSDKSEKDEAVRRTALLAIASLGHDGAEAKDAVVKLLDDPEMLADAADALGRMGPAARSAQPRLAALLSHADVSVRWVAVRAMSQIGGPEAGPAVDFMLAQITGARFTEAEGYNMMVYFALIGPDAAKALPALERL